MNEGGFPFHLFVKTFKKSIKGAEDLNIYNNSFCFFVEY